MRRDSGANETGFALSHFVEFRLETRQVAIRVGRIRSKHLSVSQASQSGFKQRFESRG
jgi:hypothetical protein